MKAFLRIGKRACWYLGVGAAGFIGGALLCYILMIRGGPSLETWHQERLDAEFTRSQFRNGEIRDFEDYRELEDRLFEQLDRQVYAKNKTGPEFALARYSAGSLVDWRGREPDWNRSFELAVENPKGGVLLLHGMSDSPYSLRVLGQRFHERGYWVIGLRYPGHGTAPSGLLRVTWEDMAAAVDLAMEHLASKTGGAPLHLVGYSTGAPLAIDEVLDRLNDGVTFPRAWCWSRRRLGSRPPLLSPVGKPDWRSCQGWRNWPGPRSCRSSIPTLTIPSPRMPVTRSHRLTGSVATRLESLASAGSIGSFPRTLVFLSSVDATVSTDAVIDTLLARLAPDGGHELMLYDINRNHVKTAILVADPGPLTARLLGDDSLPFSLTLVTNGSIDSNEIVSRHKPPLSAETSTVPLDLAWPPGVVSLSHIALSFPPDDPLYGRQEFSPAENLNLGEINLQGERNLLAFPSDWLLRLRHNPFYEHLEARALEWVGGGSVQ